MSASSKDKRPMGFGDNPSNLADSEPLDFAKEFVHRNPIAFQRAYNHFFTDAFWVPLLFLLKTCSSTRNCTLYTRRLPRFVCTRFKGVKYERMAYARHKYNQFSKWRKNVFFFISWYHILFTLKVSRKYLFCFCQHNKQMNSVITILE